MRCGPPEIALGAVLVDGELETPHCVLGRFVAVDLEGVDVCIGRIVGLFQVGDLDVGGLFEGLACFAVCDVEEGSVSVYGLGERGRMSGSQREEKEALT